MLELEKIISSLLTFPGIFIILWGIVSVYLFYINSNFFIKLIAIFSLLLMIFMYTALGIQVLVFPLEKYYAQDNFYTIDKKPIVVLGGGINYGIPKKESELSVHSLERLLRGYELQEKLNSDILYTGGVAVSKSGVSEADIAEKWLQNMEIHSDKIIKEEKARTTYENGLYVKEWMENNEIEDIYLVTSAIHMPRASAVFSKLDIDFTPVVSGYSYNHTLSWLDYLPSRGALTANLAATHEWLGLIWYTVNGRI
ncbi:MAG: YdcF family protein [Candidatus Woesearchaeota archaeon]